MRRVNVQTCTVPVLARLRAIEMFTWSKPA
jgi:hypothetical protein